MNLHTPLLKPAGPDATQGIVKLAILAVGGQGGGVVTNWVVALAESQGWYAQATSVAGVAQRTGATIYYVEMVPDAGARTPVLSLSPAAGDVDIVLAAELMEAGRAIQRGFVTPDRTTLVASSHRALAVGEKTVPGNGILDSTPILDAARQASQRFHSADLETLAVSNGSVISASLFGALAGSAALPFPREVYEETIRRSGKGVEASLRAFAAGFDAVTGAMPDAIIETTEAAEAALTPVEAPLPASHAPGIEASSAQPTDLTGPDAAIDGYRNLQARIDRDLPVEARDLARAGLRKVVDFQDLAYGSDYLDRLSAMAAFDDSEKVHALTATAAKYVANAMAYDDVIRVADLKTRAARTARVKREVGVRDGQLIQVTEYMHPRMEEVCGCLPAGLGRAIEARPKLFAALDRIVSRGRRVRTDGVFWFSALYTVSSLRPYRRRLLRHAVETAHLDDWLQTVHRLAPTQYDLAVEVLRCRRLIKGYSDTHARGLSKYDRVLAALPLLEPRDDGADWLRRLREAALMDEKGAMLDGALKTVATL